MIENAPATAELDQKVSGTTPVFAAPSHPPSSPLSTSDKDKPFAGLRVLIAEDVSTNREVIKIFLDPLGCHCVDAANGREALEALSVQNFDIVLMDIRMPEMDGITATQIIRQSDAHYKDIPIIALTADVTADNHAECIKAGVNLFLKKPVMQEELIAAIADTHAKALRRQQEVAFNTGASATVHRQHAAHA